MTSNLQENPGRQRSNFYDLEKAPVAPDCRLFTVNKMKEVFMEYLKLIGILIVIIGFALKLDSILIIICAMIVTALVGGIGIEGLLTTLGKSFVSNRGMAIFILIMLVTGTLERNGLKEAATELISKFKAATAGKIVAIYGLMRGFFGAFNVSFGGVAGFVRPVVAPMAISAAQQDSGEINETHIEEIKGMASAMENIAWFFCQVLFVGGSGALLVQSTLADLGYEVNLIDLARVEIPAAIFAVAVGMTFFILKDSKLRKKFYGKGK